MLENLDIVLSELAGKLNIATPRIWQALENQISVQLVFSCLGLFLSIVALIFGILLLKKGLLYLKPGKAEEGCYSPISEDKGIIYIIFSGTILLFSFILGIHQVITIIQITMNPDFYILKEIIGKTLMQVK